jgi:hypothetical protein
LTGLTTTTGTLGELTAVKVLGIPILELGEAPPAPTKLPELTC